MFRTLFAITLAFTLALPHAAHAQTRNAAQKVDLLFVNGKIFTADEANTIVEAVAISGKRIIATGTTRDLRTRFPTPARTIDLQGKLVTPGFNDAHLHFLGGGLSLLRVDLAGTRTLDEALRRVAARAKELPAGAWIEGRGWDHTLWGGKFPTRGDLDRVAPANPVILVRIDGHVSWTNTLALTKANVTRATPNPEGGEIERDAAGEPTGILKETAAGLVARIVPEPSRAEQMQALERAMQEARSYGITSIQDNSGYETTKLYRDLLRADKLTVRVAEWQNFENTVDELKRQRAEFAGFKDDPLRMRLTALKGYVDGTLGSRTAAMLAPFHDDKANSGIPRRSAEELTRMIVERDAADFQITLHAIGDRANNMALDGYQAAASKRYEEYAKITTSSAPKTPVAQKDTTRLLSISRRHRIEHAQVIAPSDFKRFGMRELGVIASMQPSHAISDKRWAGDRLGEYRTLGAYAWHTMRAYGVRTPFGTDFPVEPINPYLGLFAAVTRQSPDLDPAGGWQPQERVSIMDAIRCYTAEGAYASFEEKEKGQIKPGMLADLVVHSRDLLTVAPADILNTEAVMTVFDGRIVFERGR